MKKLVLAVCMCLFLSVPAAWSACTAQEFQKVMAEMEATMGALSKDGAKMDAANAAIEKEFEAEAMEFGQMAQSAGGDPAKTQAVLDKGCDLYGRINKRLNEFK